MAVAIKDRRGPNCWNKSRPSLLCNMYRYVTTGSFPQHRCKQSVKKFSELQQEVTFDLSVNIIESPRFANAQIWILQIECGESNCSRKHGCATYSRF